MSQPQIQLCCIDLAGTTVVDEGAVLAAFGTALDAVGVPAASPGRKSMERAVGRSMGTSKIEVFRQLLGDEALAREANGAFERAYGEALERDGAAPIPGARETIEALQRAGLRVALHTGFSAVTRDRLLGTLGWQDLADLVLCPAEAGRGRPYPDMILASVLALRIDDVRLVAAVGDTAADMAAGVRAGASIVAGVLTGADARERLEEAGATHVLSSVAELPRFLGLA
ncbi:MAG: HAD-IA family hydrolase [Actinomycetota bacterium]|nr:HAD-IA family hydrolase [Actinomycetota bacterium]